MKNPFPPGQLDLFNDSVGTTLANDVVDALLSRDARLAGICLERLYRAVPAHPGFGRLSGLAEALRGWPCPAGDAGEIDDTRRWLEESIEPAARAVMPFGLGKFMRPFWSDLAEAASALAYDSAFPWVLQPTFTSRQVIGMRPCERQPRKARATGTRKY